MLKIFIADESITYRSQIEIQLALNTQVKVVGSSRIGPSTLSIIESAEPDLVILDLGEDGEAGFDLLEQIHAKNLRFTVLGLSRNPDLRMKAFSLGCRELVDKESTASDRSGPDSVRVARLTSEFALKLSGGPAAGQSETPRRARPSTERFEPRVVVIASSTGGPAALEIIFNALKPNPSIPVLITQHMPESFTRDLALRLSKVSGVDVREAIHGEAVAAGTVYVAPGNFHMRLINSGRRVTIALDQGDRLHSVRPAADYLFKTAAEIYGKDCMGFVLTGMGSDGAEGAQFIRDLGGKIMIQDKATSAVWGMPGAAHTLGAFDAMGSIEEIGEVLAKMTRGKAL